MKITNLSDDKTLFIMPHEVKKKVLKSNHQLINIKSLTKQELMTKLIFSYDEKTIYYLVNNYHIKVDVALMYLPNMYYLDEDEYESNKLNNLMIMKKDLLNHNLLIKDSLFLKSLKGFKVIVYGYDDIDAYFQKLLAIISEYAKVEIIDDKEMLNDNIEIYEFNDIDEEVNFVAYSICDLINKGMDINKIKLGNVTNDYVLPLKRIFSFYNIPLNINENLSLYGTNIALSFIESFKETHCLKTSLEKLETQYNLNNPDVLDIYNKIVNVCNDYLWYDQDKDDITNMLVMSLKNVTLPNPKVTNAIEIIDLKNNIFDDEYLFVMSFNQGVMPAIYKNEDFITDDIAELLKLETTVTKNIKERERCLKIIKSLPHATITYKRRTNNQEYYPSSLISDLKVTVIKNYKLPIDISYSRIQDQMNLSKMIDKLVKYDELADNLDVMYNNYDDIPYKAYDNSFKGIDNEVLLNYLKPKLKLSYSAIDDYFKCAFKYYINHVMRINKRDEAFHLVIGNLFHYVLSFAFKPDFDFDKVWNDGLKDQTLSSKEAFFLTKLRDELKFIIKTITEQNKLSTFDKALYEEKIYVNKDNKIDVTFSGIVDKIMYKEGSKTLVSIVDYKTGNTDINLDNVIHGLNMQLPIYLYLVKQSHKFDNPAFVGFYLQEILHNEIYKDYNHDYETLKQNALKLKGYTLDQEDLITQFDSSYLDSRVIKSMRVGKNGFYQYSKILNEERIDKLIDLIDTKIDEGSTDILNGKFDINPKRLNGKNVACEFCELCDMCYMKDSDIVTLKEYKYDTFLGGESNE